MYSDGEKHDSGWFTSVYADQEVTEDTYEEQVAAGIYQYIGAFEIPAGTKRIKFEYYADDEETLLVGDTVPILYSVKGDKGATGVGIESVTEHYLAYEKNTGVTLDTEGWDTVTELLPDRKYLWNYETVKYDDGSSVNTDPVVIGAYGDDGVGISQVIEYYLASALKSGVTHDTEGWDTDPTTQVIDADNKPYLWNYEKIVYTDSSKTPTLTEPALIGSYGVPGDPGSPGDPGKDGQRAPQYWGTSEPSGVELVEGDFYLDTDKSSATYGEIVVYSGEAWEGKTLAEVPTLYNTAINDGIANIVSDADATQMLLAVNAWIQNLVAETALISKVFAKKITLLSGGSIQTEGYDSAVTCDTIKYQIIYTKDSVNYPIGPGTWDEVWEQFDSITDATFNMLNPIFYDDEGNVKGFQENTHNCDFFIYRSNDETDPEEGIVDFDLWWSRGLTAEKLREIGEIPTGDYEYLWVEIYHVSSIPYEVTKLHLKNKKGFKLDEYGNQQSSNYSETELTGYKFSKDGVIHANQMIANGGEFRNITVTGDSAFSGEIHSGPLDVTYEGSEGINYRAATGTTYTQIDSDIETAFSVSKSKNVTVSVNSNYSYYGSTSITAFQFYSTALYVIDTSGNRICVHHIVPTSSEGIPIASGTIDKELCLSTKEEEAYTFKLTNLPTTQPSETGRVWNDNGTLKVVS